MELHHTFLLWTAVGLTFFVAGITKGLVGLGLPTVSVALLSLIMPPLEAAAILIIPSLVTNAWQMAIGPGLLRLLRRFWPMLAGIFAGTLATGSLWAPATGGYGPALLGILLVVYGLSGLADLRLAIGSRWERWLSPVAGAATGAIAAVTGVFVVPAVPFLQGLGLDKDALVQALGLAFTVSTIALAVMLGVERDIGRTEVTLSLFALAPAIAGMAAGQRIRQRLSVAAFRKCLFFGLIAIGVHLILAAGPDFN